MAVETQITTAKEGVTKKALVLACVDAVAKQGEKVPDVLISAISSLVDGIVVVLNGGKVFSTTSSNVH